MRILPENVLLIFVMIISLFIFSLPIFMDSLNIHGMVTFDDVSSYPVHELNVSDPYATDNPLSWTSDPRQDDVDDVLSVESRGTILIVSISILLLALVFIIRLKKR